MGFLIIIFILIIGTVSAADECWWTGCQPDTWAEKGCNDNLTEQRAFEECDGGNKYRCCRKNGSAANTTITNELVQTPGCWWTGCQPMTWAVRGCNQEGVEERRTSECEDGNRYQCCPSHKPQNSIYKIDTDSGMSYLNLAKYLIAQNPIFKMGERLSCPLLDPDKKFLVKFGNYVVSACELCPSFNQRHYRNRILHQDPVRTLSGIDFPECFGACVEHSTDCIAFTHDSVEQICYQFDSTIDTRMSTENGCSTVIMTQPTGRAGQWSYTRNTKLVSKTSTRISSRTFQDCIASCDTVSDCLAVSYHFDSLACNQFSDVKKIDSSLAIGYASAFKQSSFASKSSFHRFKLMNDDLLIEFMAEYQIPRRADGRNSSSTSDSSSAKAKHVLSQIEKHLEECLRFENCFAVTFGPTYFNPTFIEATNVKKISSSSIVYVLKNFLKGYNLIPSSKLAKSIVQTGRNYVERRANSLLDCATSCDSQATCNRFSYVERTRACTLSSIDGMINLTVDESEQVVAIRDFSISYTGHRYTEIPGYTAHPETDGQFHLATRRCSSNCHESCRNACSAMHNCTTVVMSQTANGIRCHFYSSGDLVMEVQDFARILHRVNTINISREFLDTLPLFQQSDVFECFDKSKQRSQASLDLDLPTSSTSSVSHRRAKRGLFDFVGNFFKSAVNTVVETVKGVAEDIGNTVKAVGKVVTGDFEGAAEAIQEVGIVQDGLNVVKSVVSLTKGDVEGAAEHFRDISYVQSAEAIVDAGKSIIEGDWDKVAELGGESAVGIAASFVPGLGRGRGKRRGKSGRKKNVDKEVKRENHSEHRDKRSTDHDERHRDNEQQSKKKSCKKRHRSRRAIKKAPSKMDCDDDDDENEDDTKFCKKLTFKNLLKKSKTHTHQCGRTGKNMKCDFECNPGYEEKPSQRLECVTRGDKLQWNHQGSCVPETCKVNGISHLIVLTTPKPESSSSKRITAYIILYNKDRKIPTWSVALHDSSEFGLFDLTGLSLEDSAGRYGSFLKHPCSELKLHQANDKAYNQAGWDRGHLTPARVIRWSNKATRSVNLYVNVAPQDPYTNRHIWEDIEDNAFCTGKKLRTIVATGTCAKNIGEIKSNVKIPSCFWKMLCYVRNGEHHVVGFLIENEQLSPNDELGIRIRRQRAFTPQDQADIITTAGIGQTHNPFLTSVPYIFRGREVFNLAPGIEGINSVQPAVCATKLWLSEDEKKDWAEGLGVQQPPSVLGKRKRPDDEEHHRPLRIKRSIGGGTDKACCSPDEMKSFLATFASNTEDDSESDDSESDNSESEDSEDGNDDEKIESTESLVSARSCGKRIVGYFTSWGKNNFKPHHAQRLTHVIFAFVETRESGEVKIGCVDPAHSDCKVAEDLAKKRLTQLLRVANHFDHLNVMFAVGGWENSQYFSAIAADPQKRLVFIASVIQMIKKYEFDGVDIDWEYPVTGGANEGIKEDKANYVILLTELRTAVDNLAKMEDRDRPYLISIAGAAGQWTLDPGYNMKGLAKQLDFFNVMTYDYFGAWASKWGAFTGPPSPLHFGMPKGFSGKTNVAWTTKYYACRSGEPHKINMGVPFYGRYWENVGDAADRTDPMWRVADSKDKEFKGGAYAWRDVKSNLSSGVFGDVQLHEKTKSKYAYNPSSRLYLGFEDPETLRHKVNFAVTSNLGGIMIWAIDQDDDELTMLNVVHDADLCANTNPTDIKFKCLPTEEQLWWTPENSDKETRGRCGQFAPLINGRYPVCDPDDPGYACCSDSGYCNSGPEFCDCPKCVNHAKNPDRLFDYARIPTAEELQFRENCKPNWANECTKDDECCSRFCFKGDGPNKWAAGLCKP